MLLADVAGDANVTGGEVAALMAVTNLVTGACVGFGAWYLSYRQKQHEQRKDNRAEDRQDRTLAMQEWERLVGLYAARIEQLQRRNGSMPAPSEPKP